MQGVFVEQADGGLRFAPAPAPTDLDIVRLLASVRRRIVRLCPECGGRLRLLATIDDRVVIEKILRHLDLPVDAPRAAPARGTGSLPGVDTPTEWLNE